MLQSMAESDVTKRLNCLIPLQGFTKRAGSKGAVGSH